MRPMLIASLFATAFALTACSAAPKGGGAGAGDGLTLEGIYHGPICGLDQPGVALLTSAEQVQALQSATIAAIPVSFERQALVVLALGEQPTGGYWARITAIRQEGGDLIVTGLANRPAPDAMTTPAITTPYAAAVIARPTATTIRSDIQSVVGQEPPAPEGP